MPDPAPGRPCRYAGSFNERHNRRGHLFEQRFSSKRIEGDVQLHNTAQYILLNPVKAGLCADPLDWRWLGGELLTRARLALDLPPP